MLEIGSYVVNETIRDFFPKSDYCGADLIEGPGVDIVGGGHELDHADSTYDLTVSCECFEHNPYWLETFLNMYRMTKAGGFVIFTCATRGRREHGTRRTTPKSSPGSQDVGWDYYRNLMEKDFKNNVHIDAIFEDHIFLVNKHSQDLYFVGKKRGRNKNLKFNKLEFIRDYRDSQQKLERDLMLNLSTPERLFLILQKIVGIPKSFASFLPDKDYQNFLVHYDRFLNPTKIALKKLLGTLANHIDQ